MKMYVYMMIDTNSAITLLEKYLKNISDFELENFFRSFSKQCYGSIQRI